MTSPHLQVYDKEYNGRMRKKLGLVTEDPDDAALFAKLFDTMQETHADFTATFQILQNAQLIGFPFL